MQSFNEAAALLPREGGLDPGRNPRIVPASMRPRHYCRGRAHTKTSNQSNGCHGFNEAAALLPREGERAHEW
ncbi:conserved hypothetical protein [Candidatus Defluviicoccus seviourii]|uniref:Uncharacterized protein n=2 Tax=root TaxID=1 RepID=A0A564WF50_9PROT|nr:conserved hypothetical protein [uncultured Defluviicoccus sp.]VUX46618.1 conserved hypothetical protein [Candidatus Defluviicoccus seviourii]